MQLRSGILGLALTSALALTASAADMYRGEPMGPGGYKDGPYLAGPSWTGFYVGVNGGYGWSASNQLVDINPVTKGIKPEGGFGGGQIGYNWQGAMGYSPLVLGVEADIQGADISDSLKVGSYFYKSNLDYFGTIRGRVGYAFDRTLVYATGGFAYGGLTKSSNSWGSQKFDDTATGYVAGGGVEYKIAPAWSVKAEYQYLNFGENKVCGGSSSCFSDITKKNNDDDYHTVRLGLNYKVGGSFYEPLK